MNNSELVTSNTENQPMNQILLEYYAGRSKELQLCEEYLKEIIGLIKEDHERKTSLMDDISRGRHVYKTCDANSKLQHELAKFFKIKKVNIYWEFGTSTAMSSPPLSFLRPGYQNKLIDGNYSNMSASIIMTENLVYHCNLNERELLAILLHELGHCFYWCPLTIATQVIYLCTEIPKNIIMHLVKMIIMGNLLKLSQWTKKNMPTIYNILNLITDWVNQVASFLVVTVGPIKVLSGVINDIRVGNLKPRTITSSVSSYGEERGADSFAAKYGYGPELVTALTKIERPEGLEGYRMVDKFGTFGDIMMDLSVLSYNIAALLTLDPHPSNNQRAQSMIKKLKRDLKESEFPKEMEDDLLKEIERLEKAQETMHDNKSNVEFKKNWYKVVDKITHGHSDIREILSFYFNAFEF